MKDYYIGEILSNLTGTDEEKTVAFNAIKDLVEDDIHTICIIVAATEITDPVAVVEIANNLDSYSVEFSIHNDSDLGKFWIKYICNDENSILNKYRYYIDYNLLAKDLLTTGIGEITPYGMLWYPDFWFYRNAFM